MLVCVSVCMNAHSGHGVYLDGLLLATLCTVNKDVTAFQVKTWHADGVFVEMGWKETDGVLHSCWSY